MNMMKTFRYHSRGFTAIAAAVLSILAMTTAVSAIGQSAVVTLGFPVGARATAMGEAFTGLANDASATYYNPAGLGQSPLTISWKTHKGDSAVTAVAARSSASFGARNYVWAGTNNGLTRFNGKIWETGESYLPDEGESVRSIALKYFNTDDDEFIDNAMREISRANGLDADANAVVQITEVTVPFTIAIRDTVTTLTLDASERLWVGTVSGLWRYHSARWQRYTTDDGLPSNRITSISVATNGDVAVATERGLALLKNSETEWTVYNDENGLPDSYVTATVYTRNNQLYIGTPQGLARLDGGGLAVFDTSSGLLSQGVTALIADSKGQIWIGGENGITIFTGARNWRRYRFPGSVVYGFAEQSNGVMWIGTNKGIITHKAGKPFVDSNGNTVSTPEWKTYHSKNALKNDNIRAIAACGKDMWIATDGAMHQYAFAETQVMLFYEQLLPAFKMADLWHGFPAVVIPTEEWGTIGFSVNFINMGSNERWSEVEEYLGESRAWEGVFGISYGLPIKEDLSLGLSAKYVVSVLDASIDGWGQTFAIDVGILKRNFLTKNLDIGFMLQNMGPSIYYMTPEEADPIPFSLRLGFAYRPIQTPFHELTLVLDAYREVVKNHFDKKPDPFWVALWTGMLNNDETTAKEELQEINVSIGAEYMYADFMALRSGMLFDYLGERFELSMGVGIKYANVNFDFSYVYSPGGFMGGFLRGITGNKEKEGSSGARDGQWRLSFLFGL